MEVYMDRLFSRENILILGTMPGEIFSGYVEAADLVSSLLDLPLRVTGTMVKEEQAWKFQQLQFQFDLNTQWVLYAIVLLSLMLLVSIIRLAVVIVRSAKG